MARRSMTSVGGSACRIQGMLVTGWSRMDGHSLTGSAAAGHGCIVTAITNGLGWSTWSRSRSPSRTHGHGIHRWSRVVMDGNGGSRMATDGWSRAWRIHDHRASTPAALWRRSSACPAGLWPSAREAGEALRRMDSCAPDLVFIV